jgi:hypothetical protein
MKLGETCQWKQKPFALAQGQMREDEVLLGSEPSGMDGVGPEGRETSLMTKFWQWEERAQETLSAASRDGHDSYQVTEESRPWQLLLIHLVLKAELQVLSLDLTVVYCVQPFNFFCTF